MYFLKKLIVINFFFYFIILVKDCGDLGILWYGYFYGFSFVYNSIVMFLCCFLYYLEGDKEWIC